MTTNYITKWKSFLNICPMLYENEIWIKMSLRVRRLETTVRSLCVRKLAPAHGADGWALSEYSDNSSSPTQAPRRLRGIYGCGCLLPPSFHWPSESYWLNRKSDRISIVDVVFGRERERSEATVRQGATVEKCWKTKTSEVNSGLHIMGASSKSWGGPADLKDNLELIRQGDTSRVEWENQDDP